MERGSKSDNFKNGISRRAAVLVYSCLLYFSLQLAFRDLSLDWGNRVYPCGLGKHKGDGGKGLQTGLSDFVPDLHQNSTHVEATIVRLNFSS